MKNIAIFYASNSGNTKKVSNLISEGLDDIKQYDLNVTHSEFINDYENIILGVSTYDNGNLQDAWREVWDEFRHINFTGKNVAIFGLGDQKNYPEHFCDAMGLLYEQIKNTGGKVVGFTSTDGYNYKDSNAIIDNDKFVGLVLDIENQDEFTESRIKKWLETLKKEFL